jgi:hypothetical protein
MTGFVILSTDDQYGPAGRQELHPDVVIGIFGIPVEAQWYGILRKVEGKRICAIRRLFCVNGQPIADGRVRCDDHGIGSHYVPMGRDGTARCSILRRAHMGVSADSHACRN